MSGIRDAGHEAVGQALLVTAVGAGALTVAGLARVAVAGIQGLVAAMGGLPLPG